MVAGPVRVACAGLVLLAGCGLGAPGTEPDETDAFTAETFVEVVVELREAARAAENVEAFEARKRELLERHGITAEDLIDWAEAHGGDISRMVELWGTIDARLAPRDTAAAEP